MADRPVDNDFSLIRYIEKTNIRLTLNRASYRTTIFSLKTVLTGQNDLLPLLLSADILNKIRFSLNDYRFLCFLQVTTSN